MLIVNDPAVIAEITTLHDACERALAANDISALNAFFWDSPHIVRYGVNEHLYGATAVAAYRQGHTPVFTERKLLRAAHWRARATRPRILRRRRSRKTFPRLAHPRVRPRRAARRNRLRSLPRNCRAPLPGSVGRRTLGRAPCLPRAARRCLFPITRKIVEGTNALSAADAFDSFYELAALARRAAAEWEKMDALLLPTAPRPYTIADLAADPLGPNTRLGTYTNFINLLDLSALAVPAGLRRDGLPWGVTWIAPAWRDADLLALGARWHAHGGGNLGATSTPLPVSPSFASPTFSNSSPVRLAVVGAHLSGLPLNHQLIDRHARLVWSGTTAPAYRFYALPNTTPPKPGLVRVATGGSAIALEVWEMSAAAFGSFVGADDITPHGGWRAYLAARAAPGA